MATELRTDIMLDDDGDLAVSADGDFVVGNSDEQNIELLLVATPGQFKQYPSLGIGLQYELKKQDNNAASIKRRAQVNLTADGYKLKDISLDKTGNFNIDFDINY